MKPTAIAILKRWNMVLMESIALSSKDPEQMNYIGKMLSAQASESPERRSKSFRKRSQSTKEKRSPQVKRSGSFNNKSATLVYGSANREPLSLSSTWSQPASQFSQGKARVSTDAHLPKHSSEFSKDTPNVSRMQSSPPPLPPRPILDELSSDEDDPDYAYIEDSEIEGPKSSSKREPKGEGERSESPSVDEQLLDIFRSIKREKKEKRKKEAEKRRAATVAYRPTHSQRPALRLGPQVPFAAADPADYIEPLSALSLPQTQTGRPKSSGDYETPVPIHKRSCSEPDNSPYSAHKSLSQPTFPLARTSPMRQSPTEEEANRPALPPRWPSSQSGEDPNISPYAIVRQILPGKILEEPPDSRTAGDPDGQPAERGRKEQPQAEPSLVREQSSTEPAAAPPVTAPPGPAPVTVPPVSTTEATPPDSSSTPPSSQASDADPPPLPPRSPIKEKLSWRSSTSSVTSNHSHSSHSSTRCSKCQRRKRPSVEKTMSDHRMQPSRHPSSSHFQASQKGSLPDLSIASVVPENSLQRSQHSQRTRKSTESHSSSDGDSNSSLHSQSNSGYLEIVADSSSMSPKSKSHSNPEEHLQQNLHMLDEVMQYFDNKVSGLSQSTTLPRTRTESHKPAQLQTTLSQNPASFHSLSSLNHSTQPPPQALTQTSNGHVPSQRINGAKYPPVFQRSHTAASLPSSPPSSHPMHPIKSMSFTNHSHAPPPPVPPRSDVSLSQSARFAHYPANHMSPHGRTWSRTPSTGSYGSGVGSPPAAGNRQPRTSSSSSPSPTSGPHPRSFRNLARHFAPPMPDMEGSSTVFFHHLKQDRRVLHSHMV